MMKDIIKITLIDDDSISHLITRKIIERHANWPIESFINPVEAFQSLTDRAKNNLDQFPNLILLDIDMPLMDGWQFLEQFEKLPEDVLQQCNVIILSSSHSKRETEKARRFRIVKDFFSKPFSENLFQRIKAMYLNEKDLG
jgi:CheY-like chemotaxis protein